MLYNILNGYGLKEDEVKEYSEAFHVGFFFGKPSGRDETLKNWGL